jgi:hypothetical protein
MTMGYGLSGKSACLATSTTNPPKIIFFLKLCLSSRYQELISTSCFPVAHRYAVILIIKLLLTHKLLFSYYNIFLVHFHNTP